MNIKYSTRPLSILSELANEQTEWQSSENFNGDRAISAFNGTDWNVLDEEMKRVVTDDLNISIHDVIEPGVNVYNSDNEAEMYIGFFEKDYFELFLMTSSGKKDSLTTTDKIGLSAGDVSEAIKLFYEGDYAKIERMVSSSSVRISTVKKELEGRYELALQKENKNSWQMLALLFAVITALVCWLLFKGAQ